MPRSRRTPRPPSSAGKPDRNGISWRPWIAAAGAIAFAALAAWSLYALRRSTTGPASPSAAIPPVALGDSLQRLLDRGAYNRALPLARDLVRLRVESGQDMSAAYRELAGIINNATMEVDARGPVTRSSFERRALAQELIVTLEQALEQAADGREAASALERLGQVSWTWGFPYDAVVAFRRAAETDSTDRELRARGQSYLRQLREASGLPPASQGRRRSPRRWSRPRRARGRRALRVGPLALSLLLAGCARVAPGPAEHDPDSIPDAYARSTAALMWPGSTRAWQITPDGDLYNGEWVVRFEPEAEGQAAPAPRVVAYEDRWLPVAHWRRASGEVRWDFEAAALAPLTPRDSGLVATVEVTATNLAEREVLARLEARFEHPAARMPFHAFDCAEPPLAPRWADASPHAPACGWAAVRSRAERSAVEWRIAPGQKQRARFVLPVYPARGSDLASWARVPHARRAEECRRYWRGALARGARFVLGDPEVERALRGAVVVLLGCREPRGALTVPIGNPFQYRDVWLRDGARAVAALALSGYTSESRALARGLGAYQWRNGAYLSQRGQLDGTGQALWAFEQALLRPSADTSVATFADAGLLAWRWCEWQRNVGRSGGLPYGAMMPFADPRDAELTRAPLVGNDAWTIAGYRSLARLLRACGRTGESAEVESARVRYVAEFRETLARAGHPDVPPAWTTAARDWGNLASVFPCGALPPDDPRAVALARRIWASASVPGLTWYGTPDSLHYYLGADLGIAALLAGRREEADRVLDAMLHWRTASGGAGEIFTRDRGEYGINLPPHATAAAVLFAAVRHALVFDDADTLMLTLGARDRWWNGATVTGAPTRWGSLDIEFLRRDSVAEWRWTAVPVWTALTLPPGTETAGPLDPPLVPGPRPTMVLAPPGVARAAVRVAPAGGPSR